MLILLFVTACTPLNGEWAGEIECENYTLEVDIEVEWTGSEYEGSGTLDCTNYYGDTCEQTFDIQMETEAPFGEQDLDVDLDDCEAEISGFQSKVSCDNPDDVEWDGADTITGEWSTCEFELERD